MDRGNPAIKRLKKEYDEIERDLAELPFTVYPLEDNFLEWHFTLSGSEGTAYEQGYYHGRLQFPADYPFSPPTLMFLTPNGRFQTNTKICLSVTGYHPEHWQPAWGVRTMLIAIRDHFSVEDRGSIGYLGFSEDDRRLLAYNSKGYSCRGCKYQAPKSSSSLTPISEGEGAASSTIIRKPIESPSSTHLVGFLVLLGFAILILSLNYANTL